MLAMLQLTLCLCESQAHVQFDLLPSGIPLRQHLHPGDRNTGGRMDYHQHQSNPPSTHRPASHTLDCAPIDFLRASTTSDGGRVSTNST